MSLAEPVTTALAAAIEPSRIVTERSRLATYRGIAWGVASSKVPLARPPAPPLAVVLPRNVPDVLAALDVARRFGTPVIPYGSGTGVQGGASPVEGSIIVDLGAMRRVFSISREDRMARVEPGVLLGQLDLDARAHGLMVGHDPWSQSIASVGGATSTNGVGYLAGKYGSMGEQVLGLEAVLASGEIVRMRGVPKASVGPSLKHLFIGAEGIFGLVTEVDVRLFPLPERRDLASFRFRRFEDGLQAVLEMSAIHLRPSMIDYEEDDPPPGTLRVGRLVDLSSPMHLAFEGFEEEVEAQRARATRICLRHGGEAMSHEEACYFWDTRHESAERWVRDREQDPEGLMQRNRARRWTSAYLNVTLPASRIQRFRERAAEELAPYRLALKASGLWGIPELYSVKLEHESPDDPRAPDELDAGADHGLRLAHGLGGSMEYCHGVGLRLSHLMDSELGNGLDMLRQLKRTLDPGNLLNPGKLGL